MLMEKNRHNIISMPRLDPITKTFLDISGMYMIYLSRMTLEKSCRRKQLQHYKPSLVSIKLLHLIHYWFADCRLDSQLPTQIDHFHSLVPLDVTHQKNATIFGYPSWVYKAQSSKDGNYYVLRRLEGMLHIYMNLLIRRVQS